MALNLIDDYNVSDRRACMVVHIGRTALRYRHRRRDEAPLRQRIKEIAVARVRYYGEERIYTLLRREGWPDNHKRVRRVYREEGLNLRSKRPRSSKAASHRMDRPEISTLDHCWFIDFVHDQLFNGTRLRALTIVDNFSRLRRKKDRPKVIDQILEKYPTKKISKQHEFYRVRINPIPTDGLGKYDSAPDRY